MSISERIKKIIKDNELNSSTFATKIGVQRSSISHIISGRNKPSLDLVIKIINSFPYLSSDWLLFGKTTSNPKTFSELGNDALYSTNDLSTKSNLLKSPNVEKVIIFYSDGKFKIYNN